MRLITLTFPMQSYGQARRAVARVYTSSVAFDSATVSSPRNQLYDVAVCCTLKQAEDVIQWFREFLVQE